MIEHDTAHHDKEDRPDDRARTREMVLDIDLALIGETFTHITRYPETSESLPAATPSDTIMPFLDTTTKVPTILLDQQQEVPIMLLDQQQKELVTTRLPCARYLNFSKLPDEVLMLILNYVRVGRICKRWVLVQLMLTRENCRLGFVSRCSVPSTLAFQLEENLFIYCGNKITKKYVQKCRSLQFNLSRNMDIRRQLVNGSVSAAEFVRMDTKELATAQARQERELVRKEWIAASMTSTCGRGGRVVEGVFRCPRCGYRIVDEYMLCKTVVDRMSATLTCLSCFYYWDI